MVLEDRLQRPHEDEAWNGAIIASCVNLYMPIADPDHSADPDQMPQNYSLSFGFLKKGFLLGKPCL